MRRRAEGDLLGGRRRRRQCLDWFAVDIADGTVFFCHLPIITLALLYNGKSLVSAEITD